jgi:hypothetical protein
VRIVKDSAGRVISRERYPNLLSRLPIVHIPNNLSPNQMFGTAEGEALLPLLHEYGDILKAALYGNKRQGRPTPTIELKDAEALEKFFEAYGKKNIDEETGEEYWTIPFSSDEVMAIVGKFTYAQPGSFAGDTEILLGLLYLIFLEHTELPEFVLGSAVASSKASVSEQMPVFIRFIEMKRQDARRWVLEVAKIVMEYMSLMGQAQVDEDIDVAFEDLTTEDGKLKLEVVKWAFTEGLLDEQSALELAPIGIEDVEGVLKKAHEEREKKAAERSAPDYGGDLEAAIARMNGNANGNQNGAASNGRANGANGAQNGVPAGEGAAA